MLNKLKYTYAKKCKNIVIKVYCIFNWLLILLYMDNTLFYDFLFYNRSILLVFILLFNSKCLSVCQKFLLYWNRKQYDFPISKTGAFIYPDFWPLNPSYLIFNLIKYLFLAPASTKIVYVSILTGCQPYRLAYNLFILIYGSSNI